MTCLLRSFGPNSEMKLSMNALLLCRITLFVSILLNLMSSATFGLAVDRLLATVNNDVVTLSDYKKFIARVEVTADRESVSEHYLKQLIEEKLILQEAKKAGIDATENEVSRSVEDFMKQNGLSRQEMDKRFSDEGMAITDYKQVLRENIISLKIIDKEVNAKVVVSAGDIKQFYENNLKLFQESPEMVMVKAIYLKLSDAPSLTEITDMKIKALRICSDIKKGGSFDKLATQFTDESLKKRDAILGEFERGMLIPVLDEKIFTLKEGEVSDPVWTKEGVYILKVVKISASVYTPPEIVREQIREKIYEQRRAEKFNEWMTRLWENASVNIRQ